MQEPPKDIIGNRHWDSPMSLSGTHIKLIALILMFLDHTGAIFLSSGSMAWTFARTFGRLSIPLYAYLTARGIKHTHDIRAYVVRLLVYAFLSEIPFDLAFFGRIPVPAHQNVFFTLALPVAAFWIFREKCYVKEGWSLAACIVFAGILAQFLHADYGIAGVLLISALVYADGSRFPMAAAVWCFLFVKTGWYIRNFVGQAAVSAVITAVWSLITDMYNGDPGARKWKKWFYAAYPVHLIVLWMLKAEITGM